MKSLQLMTAAVLGTLAMPAVALASDLVIDPSHTTVQFTVRHMMMAKVRGQFEKVSGTVNLDDKDLTKSTVEMKMDAGSINTRDAKRDGHLKSPDFLDAQKFPELTFKSTKIEKAGKGKFKVTGDFTMHGVTKPIVLTVEGPTAPIANPWGVPVRAVSATGKINRKDWGLVWNKALEAGGVLVGDEVELNIDAELNPAPTAAAAPAAPAAAPGAAAAAPAAAAK